MDTIKILSLNCEKGYHSNIGNYFKEVLSSEKYDFLLLQEANDIVMMQIEKIESNYRVARKFDDSLQELTHESILYRKDFYLDSCIFHSFARHNMKIPYRGWGIIISTFIINDKKIVIGSAHLHPGIITNIRTGEMSMIKKLILKIKNRDLTIFGGDFNMGLRREILKNENILLPEYTCVTEGLGPTFNSKHTANFTYFRDKVTKYLGKIGIGIKLQLDHIYFDTEKQRTYTISSKIMTERVSDHNPIEVIMTKKI